MSRKDCTTRSADATHLFGCPVCRRDLRLVQAWKGLSRPGDDETPVEVEGGFVQRVTDAIRRDRARQASRRFWTAAAAALLFFFFAGLAHERASKPAASVEESYASLASPGALDGLIPN